MDKLTKDAIIRDLKLYIGDEIRMARLARRMTLRELSEATGITSAALCKIENGETDMKLSTLAVLRSALALDITVKPLGKGASPNNE